MCPGDALQPRYHHRAEPLSGMLLLPFGFEAVKVASDLGRTLRHHPVEWLQLRHLTGHWVERQAVLCEGLCEVRVRGDDRGAESADRALLLEQRRSIERPPLPSSKHPSTLSLIHI